MKIKFHVDLTTGHECFEEICPNPTVKPQRDTHYTYLYKKKLQKVKFHYYMLEIQLLISNSPLYVRYEVVFQSHRKDRCGSFTEAFKTLDLFYVKTNHILNF